VKGVSYAKTDKVQKSLPFSGYIGIKMEEEGRKMKKR